MLTKEQIIEAVASGRESRCLDGRDYSRLSDFFPASEWPMFGFSLKDGKKAPTPKPFDRDSVIAQMRIDVAFGFEKALDMRGISSSLMHCTVKMWLWVLEDELQHDGRYAQYGLPLFKAVANKYGFPDEIPGKNGDENEFLDAG